MKDDVDDFEVSVDNLNSDWKAIDPIFTQKRHKDSEVYYRKQL